MFLCLASSLSTQAQIQMNVKSFNSLRPAKKDVAAIEAGIEDVRKQIADKGNSSRIGKDISLLESMVGNIRKDFKKYKKLSVWDAELAKFKEQKAALKSDEDLAYQAKKKKDDAIAMVAQSLRKTGIEQDIKSYQSNPGVWKGNDVAQGFYSVMKSLEEFRSEYPNETESEILGRAIAVETYVQGEFLPSFLEIIKENRQKVDKVIAEKRMAKPDEAIRTLEKRTKLGFKIIPAFPEVAIFAENQEKDKQLLQEIKAYKEDGRFEQYKIDQVVIDAPEGKDAYVEADVKKALEKKGYEVVVVSIQDDRWVIVKNDFDLPKHKEKAAVLGLRKDGKCYRMWGTYRQPYAGAGTYMEEGYFRWNDPKEMNCNNLK